MLITCPTCRLEVLIPPEGVASLPTNILLQAFLESIKPETTSTSTSTSTNASTSAKAHLSAAAVAARKSEFQCSSSTCLSGNVPNLSCCPHCQQVNKICIIYKFGYLLSLLISHTALCVASCGTKRVDFKTLKSIDNIPLFLLLS